MVSGKTQKCGDRTVIQGSPFYLLTMLTTIARWRQGRFKYCSSYGFYELQYTLLLHHNLY